MVEGQLNINLDRLVTQLIIIIHNSSYQLPRVLLLLLLLVLTILILRRTHPLGPKYQAIPALLVLGGL